MASRKEEKERRRQERLAREQELRAQERRRRRYAIVAGSTLVVAAAVAIGVVIAAGGGGGSSGAKTLRVKAIAPPPQKTQNLVAAAKAARCKLSNPPIEGRNHVTTPVKYGTNPPTSGNHDPIPAEDGAYEKAPGIGHLVHSLEHGRVEYQYKPSLPKQRIAQLKGLFDENPLHVILTPNPTHMPFEVAAVAWGHFAGCRRMTDRSFDVLRAFNARYRDKGPEFVP